MSGVRGALAVAWLELQQSVLRPMSLALGLLFVAIIAGAAVASREVAIRVGGPAGEAFATSAVLGAIAFAIALFGPIVPIVTSVLAIVEERSTRTIDLLLSRPVTRRGLVLGKILGRSLHVVLLAVVGIVLGLMLVVNTGLALVPLLAFVALVAMLCVAWVSVAVLISSVVRGTTVALAAAFGVYLTVVLLWAVLVEVLRPYGLAGVMPFLNPNTLFLAATVATLPLQDVSLRVLQPLSEGIAPGLGLPMLLAFTAVAVVAAVLVFDRQDEAGT